MIMAGAGIHDVRIERIRGDLTDHYSPNEKVLRLSDSVYGSTSVAALGVAAHECGHALQHAHGYAPLKVRTKLVPVVSFASSWITWILLAGILLIETFPIVLEIGVALFALTTLFSFIINVLVCKGMIKQAICQTILVILDDSTLFL